MKLNKSALCIVAFINYVLFSLKTVSWYGSRIAELQYTRTSTLFAPIPFIVIYSHTSSSLYNMQFHLGFNHAIYFNDVLKATISHFPS